MKAFLCLLAALSAAPAFAQTGTVTVAATCRSWSLNPTPIIHRTTGASSLLCVTTFDQKLGVPLFVPGPSNTVLVSSELRPRAGQPGVFEADYGFWGSTFFTQYGFIVAKIPTTDADGNGIADIYEMGKAFYGNVTGTVSNTWPIATSYKLDGRFIRNANSTTGAYSGTLTGPVASYVFSGTLGQMTLQGQANFVRGTPSQIEFNLTRTDQQGYPSFLTGACTYTATPDAVSLPRFTLGDTNGNSYVVRATTLQRMGKRYIGSFQFIDGALETAWPDYLSWVVEISNALDSDANGIPDLSDPLAIPDTKGPALTVGSASPASRVTNPSVSFRGTASDRSGVKTIEYRLENTQGTGDYQAATGTTNWAASIGGLIPGTNTIRFRARDSLDNLSPEITRRVVYVVLSPLTLLVSGSGTVTPNLNQQSLEVGKTYQVVAAPKAGNIFSNWSGSLTGEKATLKFVMQTNLVLQANFVPNPFIPAKGTYNGLFLNSSQPDFTNSGPLSLTLASDGTFSGKIRAGEKGYTISGKFNAAGITHLAIPRAGASPITLDLQLDLAAPNDRLAGSVSDGNWSSDLAANRTVFSGSNPAPYANKFNLVLPAQEWGQTAPAGYGYANAQIGPGGQASLSGLLADGTAVSQAVPISRNGEWPVYISLYGGKGALLGWVKCGNPADPMLFGQLLWTRPPQPLATRYASGFSEQISSFGTAYAQPPAGTPLLTPGPGEIAFAGGGLTTPFTNQVSFTADNRVINHSPNALSITLYPGSGRFTGTVTPPGAAFSLTLKGVLLQDPPGAQPKAGFGYFLGTTESGSVDLQSGL